MMRALQFAVADLVDGARLAPLWINLGWEQTVSRFRRTILGPFWLTANLLAIAFALAFVLGSLTGNDYRTNFALIVSGILAWTVLGGVVGESASAFINASGIIQTQKLPLSFHVYLIMWKAVINFAAQLLALWAVLALMGLGALPTWHILLGFPLVITTMFLISLAVAFPSTRFRDVNQTVQFVVQLMFFVTPVFWSPEQVTGNRRIMADWNPLAHLLELIRQPLLGRAPDHAHWFWAAGTAGVMLVVVIIVLARHRRDVVFWL